MTSDEKVTYFGETDSRNKRIKFGIKAKDRTKHMYVIGKTGMGKSTLLENMAIQDIQSGEGLCFIDPHGKTAELLLNYIPENRVKDVLYFAPFDVEHPIAFNVMEDVGYDKRHLVVSGLMSTFRKIWVDAWSARMEYILSNTLLALLEYPGATLLGVNKMLSDKAYRKKVVDNIGDPAVKSFWVDEFAKYTDRFAAEATPAIQNKIGQFTSNPLIRNIIGQPKSSFDLRKMMDERKIIIVNLSKGRVGESNANLLGAMLITKVYLAAMSRADVSESVLRTLPNFYLYVDEFQSFANESFADILSEARKYKLNLTIAHQYIEQMSEEVRAAVFGNVGTMIVFRVGSYDAEVLEKEFAPQFTAEDIVNLGMYQMYLKLMIDGVGSQPFSARGLAPTPAPPVSLREQAIQMSRVQFGQLRSVVEDHVRLQTLGESAAAAMVPAAPAARPHEDKRDRRPQASAPVSASAPAAASAPIAARLPARPANNRRDSRDTRDNQNRNQDRRNRPAPPPPPDDVSDGFQGLAALKTLTSWPERKGVTAESRQDLKQALAAIVKAPVPPPPATVQAVPQRQAPQQKPTPQANPAGNKEVPEDVLKKILDM
ncbi:MAG: type IV secretion system DNA-binding domain-containing protein [Patescibacteria group bacterium]|nr:type IV secretion system DNA-binding domain-containing protein [Patescibacteria group bacterium]MDE2116758.1 type IV secretion system DNA-binding domain-containing protein [Patescibacteria group bacterium]